MLMSPGRTMVLWYHLLVSSTTASKIIQKVIFLCGLFREDYSFKKIKKDFKKSENQISQTLKNGSKLEKKRKSDTHRSKKLARLTYIARMHDSLKRRANVKAFGRRSQNPLFGALDLCLPRRQPNVVHVHMGAQLTAAHENPIDRIVLR